MVLPMNIEVGCYYLRLDGNVVGPVKPINPTFSDRDIFPFVCGGNAYKPNGKYLLGVDENPHPYDLVKKVFVTIPED
jgi:hypothetical protein